MEEYNEFMRKEIKADSFGYMIIEGLTNSIGWGDDMHCLACLTGREPYAIKTY